MLCNGSWLALAEEAQLFERELQVEPGGRLAERVAADAADTLQAIVERAAVDVQRAGRAGAVAAGVQPGLERAEQVRLFLLLQLAQRLLMRAVAPVPVARPATT